MRTIIFLFVIALGNAHPQLGTESNSKPISDRACVCVPTSDCLVGDGLMEIITTRNEFCNTNEVCCQFKGDLTVSEDEFSRILGINDSHIQDGGEIQDQKCVCIHEDDCADDFLDIFIHTRTGNPCTTPFFVCCDQPFKEPSTKPPCTCVHEDRCFDPDVDLAVNVNVRTGACSKPFHVCCHDFAPPSGGIEETSPVVPTCKCVNPNLCADVPVPVGFDPRFNHGLNCDLPQEVCCEHVKTEPDPVTPAEPDTTTSDPLPKPNCGTRHPKPISIDLRIRGGGTAKEGEYPWMVAILRKNKTGQYEYACGGSLIHPSVVLTVAHCIDQDDGNLIQVRIGELNLSGATELFGHAEFFATGKVLHPQFSRRSLRFDLGLLFIPEEIYPVQHMNTICLPTIKSLRKFSKECFSSGWGKDAFGSEGKYQNELKKIDLPLVSKNDCQNALRTTHLTERFKLHRSFVCAGGEGKDTCSGDGGSPLVCPLINQPNKYVQVGAVAWGVGCGQIGLPGVYASIKPAVNWIVDTVNANYGPGASDWFTL